MVVKLTITLHESGKEPRTILSDLMSGDSLILGRGQSVQLWVNDKNISREHCKISCENDQIFVEDLGSRNGTFVNSHRIPGKSQLKNQDRIRLASSSSLVVTMEQSNKKKRATINKKPLLPPESQASSQPTRRVPVATGRNAAAGVTSPIQLPRPEFSLMGEVFNGYKIEEKIGSGGMAVVYKGTHLALNRPVAVKTLAQRLIQNERAIKRFLNVAKVSGQLAHPNIVQIYDSGVLDEHSIYYIVMEYVEGESLSNLLKDKQKLDIEQTCKIIGYIASALMYANKRNIIHRDINPSNILVGNEDVPKLIGLGLAKCLDDEMTSLTQPGQGMGLVGYIAPEQLLDASKANHRSDIYSLGAVFYRCLCGQTPYDTKNMREYFNCIHKKIPPVPPHEINPEVPRSISDMVIKALSHDPEKRFASAESLVLYLKNYLSPRVNEDGLEKARKQLMAMLPSRTSVPGFEFESIYRPYEGIGGDFYDFIELNENEIGIMIGDVTGHGLEAAVVVGMVKATVKIFGKQYSCTSEALAHANREIYPDLDATTFATVFYGVIDRVSHKLRFTRAGHNPLILYNPSRPQPLMTYEPKGMVIGMFKKCSCDEVFIDLKAGDCLIQYTDGITEAMNSEQEEFGMERLCQCILDNNTQDIKEILSNIENSVTKFTGAEQQQDDIAIIGMKVL